MKSKRQRDIEAEAEKEALLSNKKHKKKNKGKTALIVLLSIIVIAILVVVVGWNVVRIVGKHKIMSATDNTAPTLITKETEELPDEVKATWKEGWVKYNDKIYEYNDDIVTFLIMGIDKKDEVKEVAEGTNGGQADALFLLVLNQRNKSINIIALNRNTMADIDVYNEYGSYITTTTAQIATQHGFGNGMEKSCEYQVNAVKKIFYNLPIHGYAAINMDAISIVNDTVGGVELKALSDVYNSNGKKGKKIISEGDTVHLDGNEAYWYVRNRKTSEFASADVRLARQKQYLMKLLDKIKKTAKDNIGVVSELYDSIKPYMVTDVSFDKVAYLAPDVIGYSYSDDSLRVVPGETSMGEEFEEYWLDEQGLYELIIDTFYDEVAQ